MSRPIEYGRIACYRCECGWSSYDAEKLAVTQACPKCKRPFDEIVDPDLYCKNCGKMEPTFNGLCAKCDFIITGEEVE